MFRALRAGDDQLVDDTLADTRLTVVVGRHESFEDMLANIGDRPDRATFLMTDHSVVDADTEREWFGSDGTAVVVLLDYGQPRQVVRRFGANDHPTDIVDAVLEFEASQGHEADA